MLDPMKIRKIPKKGIPGQAEIYAMSVPPVEPRSSTWE